MADSLEGTGVSGDRPRVLIAGAGPAGLVTAIELGRRGIPAVLVDPAREPPGFPKANATTARSMEHYRRLGFAQAIRAHALPAGHPTDIAYFTRYSSHELARLSGEDLLPSAASDDGGRWPTAEPLARVQQMHVEAVMRAQLARWPAVAFLAGWRLTEFSRDADGVRATITDGAGARRGLRCDYLVGAEGARSLVRQTLGIGMGGSTDFDRDFFGGRMLATYFRSRDFYGLTGPRAWQYWAVNGEQRGLLCAIDGSETFVHHTPLPAGQTAGEALARRALEAAMGRPFEFEILGCREWMAGFALVADRFADDAHDPRVFLAGDAAHMFTPTGGQGYNTAVDDAVNLGWKLAAVCGGWGDPRLLASYALERRPIAERNTGFARAMAESIGRMPVPPELEGDDRPATAARAALGRRLRAHVLTEFDIPGITFGVYYGDSPVVCGDGLPPPPDAWNDYAPCARPGARAPHVRLHDGTPLHDRFGRDFTLLFTAPPRAGEAERLALAGATPGGALEAVVVDEPAVGSRYEARCVLVRPDHHVAWRGEAVGDDMAAVLARVGLRAPA